MKTKIQEVNNAKLNTENLKDSSNLIANTENTYNEKDFISSLRKVVEQKKVDLNLSKHSSLYGKGMQKAIEKGLNITNSYKANNFSFAYFSNQSLGLNFGEYRFSPIYQQDVFLFDKIMSEISKGVQSEINTIIEAHKSNMDMLKTSITEYLKENMPHDNVEVSYIFKKSDLDNMNKTGFESFGNALLVYNVLKASESDYMACIKLYKDGDKEQVKEFYTLLNSRVKISKINAWSFAPGYRDANGQKHSARAEIRDLIGLISVNFLLTSAFSYIQSSEDEAKRILSTVMEKENEDKCFFSGQFKPLMQTYNTDYNIFNKDSLTLDDVYQKLNLKTVKELMVEDICERLPREIIRFINLCSIGISNIQIEIEEYEDYLIQSSKDYAQPYMTKKNITQKVQAFMDNNKFLNMFDYVEADVSCDLDKLRRLEKEFVDLSAKLDLPILNNHSLRFRKLGKFKALGVYFPGFKTVCIDLDGVSSFIHEFFHAIDYTQGILSLDYKFNKLASMYSDIVDSNIESLGEDNEIYKMWNSKTKYNQSYFLNKREIFARLGEIYVSEILNIKSSFNAKELTGIDTYVYPNNDKLNSMIKSYYDELFSSIKGSYKLVNFKSINNNSSKEKESFIKDDANVIGTQINMAIKQFLQDVDKLSVSKAEQLELF